MDSETNPQDPGCRSDLSVLIPLYNEEATIGAVLDRILDLGDMIHEVIVVDDGSSDGSADAVEPYCEKDERIRLIRCEKNKGKTNAIRTALEHVTGEIVVIQDADLEYDPHELPDVVRPIQANKADVVYGSRFLVRRATRVLYFYHFLANRFLTFLSNLLTNRNMTDIETCYKAFYAPVITELQLTSKGFGMEVEITAMICRSGNLLHLALQFDCFAIQISSEIRRQGQRTAGETTEVATRAAQRAPSQANRLSMRHWHAFDRTISWG